NVNNRMVAVGIKTGDIEQVLNKIADGYERANEKKINNIISIIEPTLVIVLSLVVGLILLSVILPLMGIMTAIG
ncbi:MAG: type II secretion system F family protein, partial [Lachnospiraceae bacterium]|nr:type II secretion system F family protein [Lachnospiraceae bacterium]